MISEALAAELEHYRIGPKLRTLRKAKKLGLVQLGSHTSLSPGLLSKIERGQIVPTLPTLLRIALVFGVGLEHFFGEDVDRPAIAVVHRGERLRFPDRMDAVVPSYFFESLNFPVNDRRMEAFLAEFPADGPASPPHSHAGAEMLYVIDGALEISVELEVRQLRAGDAASFDPIHLHSYRAIEGAGCTAIVVVAPDPPYASHVNIA
jgi:transcriptional regulator with XRE-family HTH domain